MFAVVLEKDVHNSFPPVTFFSFFFFSFLFFSFLFLSPPFLSLNLLSGNDGKTCFLGGVSETLEKVKFVQSCSFSLAFFSLRLTAGSTLWGSVSEKRGTFEAAKFVSLVGIQFMQVFHRNLDLGCSILGVGQL